MKTFIEQKSDLERQIEELERQNRRLYDEIDNNEIEISKLKITLSEVGTEIED